VRKGQIAEVALGLGALAGLAGALLFWRAKQRGTRFPRLFGLPVEAPTIPSGSSAMARDYTPQVWEPLLRALILKDYPRIDPRVAMKWLVMESGGSPCSFGRAFDLGPDGSPREIGLGQIYNPDDFKALGLETFGITPASFRAYCVPNTQLLFRALTSKEMEDQARFTLLAKIAQSMDVADRAIAKHGLHWAKPDYWKLVKSVHALPSILSQGLPAVVQKLGRPPSNWIEFRQVLGTIPRFLSWSRALNNAEKLSQAVVELSV
jgi:hypothetical protein